MTKLALHDHDVGAMPRQYAIYHISNMKNDSRLWVQYTAEYLLN